jgi:hypothetical protein
MNDYATIDMSTGEVVERHEPTLPATLSVDTKLRDVKLDALAEAAARIKDLVALEEFIDEKIALQTQFVKDWKRSVAPGGRPRNDRDGANNRASVIVSVDVLEKRTGILDHQVSRWHKRTQKPDAYKLKLVAKYSKELLAILAGNLMSETNEWYTPEEYIASVRAVFGGGIDLDPASCETANRVVQAANIFTENDRGEIKEWFGRVFMNPPYGTDKGESRAGKFCNKAIAEYEAGRVAECIILVNSVHAQGWQRPLYDFPLCLVDHRIQFMDAEGEINPNPTFMNLFAYLGPNKDAFAHEFSKHGYVVERLRCS